VELDGARHDAPEQGEAWQHEVVQVGERQGARVQRLAAHVHGDGETKLRKLVALLVIAWV